MRCKKKPEHRQKHIGLMEIKNLNKKMANKKSTERNVRKLTKIGRNSVGITFPIEIVRSLGWRERQRVSVKRVRGGVIVRDYRSK